MTGRVRLGLDDLASLLPIVDGSSDTDLEIVEALRVGRPPRHCTGFTYGRESVLARLDDQLARIVGSRPLRIRITGEGGIGTSHVLRCATEAANRKGLAVMLVGEGEVNGVDPRLISLVERTTFGDVPLVEALATYLPAKALVDQAPAVKLISQAARRLSPEAGEFISQLWTAAAKGEASILSLSESALHGAPSRGRQKGLADAVGAEAAAVTLAFARLSGAAGLLIVIDDVSGEPAGWPTWLPRVQVQGGPLGAMMAHSGRSGIKASSTDIFLPPIDKQARLSLIGQIRNLHARAYTWPTVASIVGDRILSLVPSPSANTRDLVRSAVGALDTELGRLEADLT